MFTCWFLAATVALLMSGHEPSSTTTGRMSRLRRLLTLKKRFLRCGLLTWLARPGAVLPLTTQPARSTARVVPRREWREILSSQGPAMCQTSFTPILAGHCHYLK